MIYNKLSHLSESLRISNIVNNSHPSLQNTMKQHLKSVNEYNDKFYSVVSYMEMYPEFKKLSLKTKQKIFYKFRTEYYDGYFELVDILNYPSYKKLNLIRDVYSTQKEKTRKKYLQLMNI